MINDTPTQQRRVREAFMAARAAEAQINNLDFSNMAPDAQEKLVVSLETAVSKHRDAIERDKREAQVSAANEGRV
ncbi:hypothetical protein CcrC1_gp373 [Caulobacter phage C1]|nr:hypothetical protein CcrC1_gp373 [Caulobacter phage C1]UTU08602.1 hypothetical protein CcrC2_gp374 [Caulobacter phage C2]UTU09117.1 hypothetical protein CcrJ4_gp368 [Caulobacter phage J4]UTU10235.1 hypothetical protein CcrRB23_gp373 [Caulobacter phage RB23]WGN97269.1 hypothetical protein [Bertelyvirus sp.]